MPEWLTVILLGLVEGITEFLPISSTGHLLLAEHWLTRQSDLFNTVIQCGAVLAVLVVFSKRLKQFIVDWRDRATQDYLAKLLVAFVITGVGGLALKHFHVKLPETIQPVAWATLIGGILFIAIEMWLKNRPVRETVTWAVAIGMGCAQLVAAAFPGTSRSGATILLAIALGLSRPRAAEFSFLLGIPTLLAAAALQTLSALKASEAPIDWSMIALGTAIAAVTAFGVVKWLLHYIQHHSFMVFGWYRIILGILMLTVVN